MSADFTQVEWNRELEADARRLARLALEEELQGRRDLTTASLVPADARGKAAVVTRAAGVVAGLGMLPLVAEEAGADVEVNLVASDGAPVAPGDVLARVAGSARDLLTCERTMLNFLGRLAGVATLTQRYVREVEGTGAAVYDTRKTTPGWRRLEKYAVRQGGGRNHRLGLYDAVLIKDNHLAHSAQHGLSPEEAVERARVAVGNAVVVEVEVDSIEQLRAVLPAGPDIVLLDNMGPEQLWEAVALRDERAPRVVLEASGGVSLSTIGAIARTGVDRISVGGLTHGAVSLDIGLDWA